MVGCPSVRPSVRLCPVDRQQQRRAAACTAERGACGEYRSIASTPAARAQQQMRAASCREPRDEAQHRLVLICCAIGNSMRTEIVYTGSMSSPCPVVTARRTECTVCYGKSVRLSICLSHSEGAPAAATKHIVNVFHYRLCCLVAYSIH